MDAPQLPEHAEPELDALLRRQRPAPDPAWVRTTGERLFRPRRRRAPALRLGAAFVGGLATLVLGLSLLGVGPLAGGDQSVQAKDDCHNVTVARQERVPSLVTARDGTTKVVYTRRLVRRTERRCG